MKKVLAIAVGVIALGAGIFFLFDGRHEPDSNVLSKSTAQNELPYMTVLMRDGSRLQLRDFTEKTILVLYQPDCDHCQREANEIEAHLDSFKDYNIYFITTESFEKIDQFAKDYNLEGHDHVFFGQTQVGHIINNFGQISAPSVYVYGEGGNLKRRFNGETRIEDIVKSL